MFTQGFMIESHHNDNVMFLCFRFFLGSNKVMQVAIGRSDSDEIRPGLHKVSKVSKTL